MLSDTTYSSINQLAWNLWRSSYSSLRVLGLQTCKVTPSFHHSFSKFGDLFLKLMKSLETENSFCCRRRSGWEGGLPSPVGGAQTLRPRPRLVRTLGAKFPSFSPGA